MKQFPMIIKPNSKVLVVGQNPGQSQSKKEDEEYEEAKTYGECVAVYEKWFKRCRFYRGLFRYFGNDWLDTGHYSYCTLVRERTEGNAKPSREAVAAYLPSTLSIAEAFTVVVAVGAVSRDALRKCHPCVIYVSHPASFVSAKKRLEQELNVKEVLKLIDASTSDDAQ